MAKLFIICGHGAGDPGCCAGGCTEAERVRALGQRIKELGGSEVELGDTSRNWYADGGLNRLSTDAPVVELHMDASGIATAHGAHVIIKEGFEPDEYDNALADKLAAFMPGRSEKLVRRSDLANPNRAAARGINYRLCENGFIDNDGDREKFNGNLVELARMARAWRDQNNVSMSGMLIDTLAYQFINGWAYKDKSYVYYDWMTRDFFAFLAGQDAGKTYWTAPGSGSWVYGSGFQYKARQAELRTKEAIDYQQNNYDYSAKQLYRGIYGTDFPS